jgi:AraC-like DNA-binding protein
MDFSRMVEDPGKMAGSLILPDIYAVREDHVRGASPRRGGSPSGGDLLSVYLRGGPRYRLDGCVYDFEAPIAMALPKGTFDADRQCGDIDGVFVLFSGHGLLRRHNARRGTVRAAVGDSRMVVPHFRRVTTQTAERLADDIRAIGAIRGDGLTRRLRRASLLMRALARYCEAEAPEGDTPGVHREAVRLRELIERRAFEDAAMAEVYAELDLSQARAGTLFKAAFGMTPVAYRTQLRLRKARELLVSTQYNVGQVARMVGYRDPLYFSRVFRRKLGVLPSALVWDFKTRRTSGP